MANIAMEPAAPLGLRAELRSLEDDAAASMTHSLAGTHMCAGATPMFPSPSLRRDFGSWETAFLAATTRWLMERGQKINSQLETENSQLKSDSVDSSEL
jgi:hypothetical protein